MSYHVDQNGPEEFKQRFAQDPLSFLEFENEVIFSVEPAEMDEIRLSLAAKKFAELKDSIGMHYNPLTKDYRLGNGLDVNYLMHFQHD